MSRPAHDSAPQRRVSWRLLGWSTAALVLLVPLVAMQFTDEVAWGPGDFAVAAVLLLAVGIPFELAARRSGDSAYRAAVGVALVAAFLLVWVSLAVGIIGSEGNPANWMYAGVLLVGIGGTVLARANAEGMSRVLLAMAGVQALIALVAIVGGMGQPYNGALELLAINGFFVALFAGAAWLFREAAAGDTHEEAGA